MSILTIKNLAVTAGGKDVLNGVSFTVRPGEIHALMGPNGSGKSSLAYTIAGHPEYPVKNGSISFGEYDLLKLNPEERARAGIFLSFQEPPEVGGVSMRIFLSSISQNAGKGLLPEVLGIPDMFLDRFLNEGFSGGEKKKSEILQFLARRPKFAIFDEIDSGLDVDSLEAVARIIRDAGKDGTGILLISHTPDFFVRIVPDRVHILIDGKIAVSGGCDILNMLERNGYKDFK